MINEIVTQKIILELKECFSRIEWEKCVFQIFFNSSGSFGSGIGYYNENNDIQLPYFIDNKGRQNLRELNNQREICQYFDNYYKDCQNNGGKWNKSLFTLFKNGEYDLNFNWDEEFFIENEYNLARASVTILYDRFYEILHFEVLKEKEWTIANLICSILGEKIIIECDVFKDEKVESYPMVLPERWQEYSLEFYKKTNEGVLKDKWKKWNKLKMKLKQGEYLDFDKDVEFVFENDI